MAKRTIATELILENEDQFKKGLASVNRELGNLASELKLTESEFRGQANSMDALTAKNRILTAQVDQQSEKVRALEAALKETKEAYGENSAEADKYQRQLNSAKVALNKMNDELQDNERYLNEARNSADKCARSIDEYGKEVKDADNASSGLGGGIEGMIGKLGKLKGALVGGAAIGAVKEIAEGIMELEESTREYRSIMGTLEVSSANAGYTAEETEETFRRLQNVLGDTQTAATATANLQAVGLEQEKLTMLVDGAIGAWATYGDSIPIDSLAEAINETIQAGKVTGTFADLLTWAGYSESEFNTKLEATTSAAERADLVLQLMAEQGLVDAADGWRTVNEDIVAANESQRQLDEAWGKMGEAIAPLANALRTTLAGAISFVADAISGLITLISNANQELEDWNNQMIEKTGVGMGGMGVGGQFSGTNWNTYGMTGAGSGAYWDSINGSHANGLYRVPYDGYVAEMHKDERILTAVEAREYDGVQESLGQMAATIMNAVEGGTGPREAVIHVTTVLGGATVDEQIYRANLRAQERHGEGLVK